MKIIKSVIFVVVYLLAILFFAQVFVIYLTEPDMFHEEQEYMKRKAEIKSEPINLFNIADKIYYR